MKLCNRIDAFAAASFLFARRMEAETEPRGGKKRLAQTARRSECFSDGVLTTTDERCQRPTCEAKATIQNNLHQERFAFASLARSCAISLFCASLSPFFAPLFIVSYLICEQMHWIAGIRFGFSLCIANKFYTRNCRCGNQSALFVFTYYYITISFLFVRGPGRCSGKCMHEHRWCSRWTVAKRSAAAAGGGDGKSKSTHKKRED